MPFGKLLTFLFSFVLCSSDESGDVGYFWHLSDIHCNLDYNTTSCNLKYGNYTCDSSPELTLYTIEQMKVLTVGFRPDFIVLSGDNVPHIDNLTSKRLLEGIKFISNAIYNAFPDVYVLPVLGNHDVNPANEMDILPNDQRRKDWCHRLGSDPDMWGRWIGLSEPQSQLVLASGFPVANFSHGCYYSRLLNTGFGRKLLLVSLNGLIWYSNNPAVKRHTNIADPLGQLAWLEQTFHWADKNQLKVLLVSHFPPGVSESTPLLYQHLRADINDRFVKLLIANADLLMACLFAHEHVDTFRVLLNDSKVPILSMFLMPSVTPLYLNQIGSFNPRIRLYKYQRSTSRLIDYTQYYLNLADQSLHNNNNNKLLWKLEYNTAEVYQLKDLSSTALSTLLDVFGSLDDDPPRMSWSNYWMFELGTGRKHDPRPDYLDQNSNCPFVKSKCRCEHLCAMRYFLIDNLSNCLKFCANLPSTKIGIVKSSLNDKFKFWNFVKQWNELFQINDRLSNSSSSSSISSTLSSPLLPSAGSNGQYVINTTYYNLIEEQYSTLPIIIGVIIAFLATLIGIVLVMNREVCHRRRGGPHPFINRLRVGSSSNGLFLNTLNGGGGGGAMSGSYIQGVNLHDKSRADGDDDYDDDIDVSHNTTGSCLDLQFDYSPKRPKKNMHNDDDGDDDDIVIVDGYGQGNTINNYKSLTSIHKAITSPMSTLPLSLRQYIAGGGGRSGGDCNRSTRSTPNHRSQTIPRSMITSKSPARQTFDKNTMMMMMLRDCRNCKSSHLDDTAYYADNDEDEDDGGSSVGDYVTSQQMLQSNMFINLVNNYLHRSSSPVNERYRLQSVLFGNKNDLYLPLRLHGPDIVAVSDDDGDVNTTQCNITTPVTAATDNNNISSSKSINRTFNSDLDLLKTDYPTLNCPCARSMKSSSPPSLPIKHCIDDDGANIIITTTTPVMKTVTLSTAVTTTTTAAGGGGDVSVTSTATRTTAGTLSACSSVSSLVENPHQTISAMVNHVDKLSNKEDTTSSTTVNNDNNTAIAVATLTSANPTVTTDHHHHQPVMCNDDKALNCTKEDTILLPNRLVSVSTTNTLSSAAGFEYLSLPI